MALWKKLSKRGRLALWFATVGVFFIAFLLLLYGIFALIVSPDRDTGTIVYKCGTGSRRDSVSDVSRALYCPGGVPYVNFTSMATACDFSISGDEDEVRYLIDTGNGEYDTVTFYYGSREIRVNGTHFMLSAAVKKEGNILLVPAEFVTLCMKGVTVETTSKQITVVWEIGKISLKPDIKPLDPIEL